MPLSNALTSLSSRQRYQEKHAVQQPSVQLVLNAGVLDRANFAKRSFSEQQVALNLTQFATANQDLDLGRDQVENLVGALIVSLGLLRSCPCMYTDIAFHQAEAPSNVVNEYLAAEDAEKAQSSSSGIPSPPASEQPEQLSAKQRNELLMLQELIRRRLQGNKT
nr:hypothetical protein CFP56_48825 [Quercus suber]